MAVPRQVEPKQNAAQLTRRFDTQNSGNCSILSNSTDVEPQARRITGLVSC
jgi:hypothetical protein